MGLYMAAIARALHRAFPATSSAEIDTLRQLALVAGAGLLVSLLMMTYGLDLSPGFF
jgi:hypothetical protein